MQLGGGVWVGPTHGWRTLYSGSNLIPRPPAQILFNNWEANFFTVEIIYLSERASV